MRADVATREIHDPDIHHIWIIAAAIHRFHHPFGLEPVGTDPASDAEEKFETVRERRSKMDQHELVSWILVVTGLLICLAALVKGAMSLFTKAKSEENGSPYWDVDWGGILIAVVVFIIGLEIIDEGFEATDENLTTSSSEATIQR